MPYKLTVDVIPPEGEWPRPVYVQHVFYGERVADVENTFAQHAAGCEFLGPAIRERRTNTELEEIEADEWPEYDD